tara:strand:- start:5895 stop:6446 length:552 start_codon:yes stop_codon:yes gene_type:complete
MKVTLAAISCGIGLAGGLLFSGSGTATFAGGCGLSVRQIWLESFTAEADTPDNCSGSEITLRVRNRTGAVVHNSTYPVSDLFGFGDVDTPADMREALEEWISRYPAAATTDRLPAWREGEAAPDHREFPFYADDGISRERYEQIRQEKRLLHCFVQGGESLLCLTPDDRGDGLEVIGIQSFPG